MVKNIFLILCLLPYCWSSAQIGINTEYPKGILHIDAKGDNGENNFPVNITDDVVIDQNGNMGLGTLNPTEKLQVEGSTLFKGKVTVNNTSKGEGKVFVTTNGNGKGTWKSMEAMHKVIIDYKLNDAIRATHLPSEQLYLMQTNASLTLSGDIASLGVNKVSFNTPLGNVENGFSLKKGYYIFMFSCNIAPKQRGQSGSEYGILRMYSATTGKEVYKTYHMFNLSGYYMYLDTDGTDLFYLTHEAINTGIKDTAGNPFFLSPPYQSQNDIAQVIIIQLTNQYFENQRNSL